jgi:hypothetical protein
MAIVIAHRYGNASKPCPVCGAWTKGCSSTADGFHFCRGDEPLLGWEQLGAGADAAGFNHYRRSDDPRRPGKNSHQWSWINDESNWGRKPLPRPTPLAEIADKPVKDWGERAKVLSTGFTTRRREELASILKLPVDALNAIPLLGYVAEAKLIDGTPTETGYWTFPETDATGKIIGIACRWRKGHGPNPTGKSQILTSTRGLTLPPGWKERPGSAFDVEGPTDTAAMYRAGFAVTGRLAASGGGALLAKLYADLDPSRDIIIVGDNDEKANGHWPGKEGAIAIARKVSDATGRLVKWALPPTGFKDVREYLTSDLWGDTPFEERGEKLRAHLEQTAVTVSPSSPIGYQNLTPAQYAEIIAADKAEAATATPTASQDIPGPCPYYALKDGRAWISSSFAKCANQRPVILRSEGVPFVCDRPCGCGKKCRACLMNRVYESLRESDSYMISHHLQAEHLGSGGPRKLYAALIPASIDPTAAQWDTLTTRIRKLEGERYSILTEDIKGVATQLAAGNDAASGFFLKDNKVQEDSRCEPTGRLFFLSLPGDAATGETLQLAGVTFRRASIGGAINGMYQAAQSVPHFSTDDANCKVTHQSKWWGNKKEKEASNVEVVWPSKFTTKESKRFLEAVQIEAKEVAFDGGGSASPGVGWILPPAQSLAVCMLLGGVMAPEGLILTVGHVADIARDVLPRLAEVPTIGNGSCVIAAMGEILWNGGADDATERLLKADAFDNLMSEAESIRDEIKKQFKNREHEAGEFVREFVLNA